MTEVRMQPSDICDFCSDPKPVWVYPAATYLDKELQAQSIGEWLACEECAKLIDRNEWNKVARRSLRTPTLQTLIARHGEEWALETVTHLHQDFVRHRKGPPHRRVI